MWVNFKKFHLYRSIEGPITVERLKCCDCSLDKFIDVNFSKFPDSNQSFGNDFVCIHYELCKILPFLIRWFLTATSGTKSIIVSAGHVYILLHQREERGSTIQHGYRKLGTHARVFSKTLTHGNSKNEIRQ